MDSKIMYAGLLYLLTLGTGVWLSHLPKPMNVALFTVHKLAALAAVILTGVAAYQAQKALGIAAGIKIAAAVGMAVVVIAAFVSGALLSRGEPVHGVVLMTHKIASALIIVAVGVVVFGGRGSGK